MPVWFDASLDPATLPEAVAEARGLCEETGAAVDAADEERRAKDAALEEVRGVAAGARQSVDELTERQAEEQRAVDECPNKEDLEAALEECGGPLEEAQAAADGVEPGDGAALEEAQGSLAEKTAAQGEAQAAVDAAAAEVEAAQAAVDANAAAAEQQGALDEAQGALDGFEPEEGEEGEVLNQADQDELQAAVDAAQGALDEAMAAAAGTYEAVGLSGEDPDELQAALEEKQAAQEEAQGSLDGAAGETEAAQGAVDEAQTSFDEANAAYEEAQAALTAATEARDAAQEAVDTCPDIEALQATLEETTEELTQATGALEEAEAAIPPAEEELAGAQTALEEAKAADGEALDGLDDACATAVDDTTAAVEAAAAALDQAGACPLKHELRDHEAELGRLTDATEQQKSLLERAEANLAAAEAAHAKQDELDGLEAELGEIRAALNEAEDSYKQAEAESKEADAQHRTLSADLKAAQEDLAILQAKLDSAPSVEEAQAAFEEATTAKQDKDAELEGKQQELVALQAAVDEAVQAKEATEEADDADETQGLTAPDEEAEAAIATAQDQVAACKQEIAELSAEVEGLAAAEAKAKTALDQVGEFDGKAAAQEVKDQEAKVAEINSACQACSDSLDGLKAKPEELKDPCAEARTAYNEKRAAVLGIRAEIGNAAGVAEAQEAIERANASIAAADAERAAKEAEVEEFQARVDEEQAEMDRLADEHDIAANSVDSLLVFTRVGHEGQSDGEDDGEDSEIESDSDEDSESDSDEEAEEEYGDDEEGRAAAAAAAKAKAKAKKAGKMTLKAGASVSLCYNDQVVSVGLGRVKIKDASASPGPDERLHVIEPAPGFFAFQNIHGRFLSVSEHSGRVNMQKSLGDGSMFTLVPMGNKLAFRSKVGSYLQAVIENSSAGSPAMLDGGWQEEREDGEIAQLNIKDGEWTTFGNSYKLDTSDPLRPSFDWPPSAEVVKQEFNIGLSDTAGGVEKLAASWIKENHPDEGWGLESHRRGQDEETGETDFATFSKIEYGDPTGNQSAEIDEADTGQLQMLGFELRWTTAEGETIIWRRTAADKNQVEAFTCTGIAAKPAEDAKLIDASLCFSIVRRSKKKYDRPIRDLPKVSPHLPVPPLIYERVGDVKNAGAEFAEEAWTNSTYAIDQAKGPIKTVHVVAEAEGVGALKLCLFGLQNVQQKAFAEDHLVDISSAPGTQLRVISATLQGYKTLDLTKACRDLVVHNRLFVGGGATSLVGDTEPGVDQIFTIKWAAMTVRAIEALGTIGDGGEPGERSFDTTLTSVANVPICTKARKDDYICLLMVSPPGSGLVCKSAKVAIVHEKLKKFKPPPQVHHPEGELPEGTPPTSYDVPSPEPTEFTPPEGYQLIGEQPIGLDTACMVDHRNKKITQSFDFTSEDFDFSSEDLAEFADRIPTVARVGADTLRFSRTKDTEARDSFGIEVAQEKSKRLIVCADVRAEGPLPVKDNVGFALTAEGSPGTPCVNSWIPGLITADKCMATFKGRETVHIQSAGRGATLVITSATLDGEDVSEAVNELVEDCESGGQQLFCAGGVYEKLGRDIPRPFGKRGARPVESIFVVQYVSWTHVEFAVTRPPGQFAVSLCLDGVPFDTQVDVANFKVYEVERLGDVDMPPLAKKDVAINELTGTAWDEQEYADFLDSLSAEARFVERCRVKASVEEGLRHIAERDAQKLRHAAKGLGTDDSALKQLLITRVLEEGPGNKHMQAVDAAFQRMYDTTLAEMIASETSGDYCEFLTALATSKAKLDAQNFNAAIAGFGTNDDLLIELVCTRTNAELIAARKAYAAMFDKDLMTEVTEDTSRGDYQKLLLTVLQATQEEDEDVDDDKCQVTARRINSAIDESDEDALIRFVCKAPASAWAPDKIPAAFEAEFGRPISDAIDGAVDGDFGKALQMKMKPSRYHVWAELLKKAGPDKLGTDESTIIRILSCCQSSGLTLARSVERLTEVYEEVVDASLAEMLDAELSFNFGDAIAQLVEGPNNEDPFTHFEKVAARWDLIDGTTAGSDWDYKETELSVLSWIAYLDAADIKEAMAGWGTDEDTLSNILSCRTQEQVTLANWAYSQMYDADLAEDIQGETSGDYASFMNYLIREKDQSDAVAFRRSLKGFGTNDDLLVLLCCSLDARQLASAQKAYAQLYGRVLVKDVESDTSGDYRKTLKQLLRCQRSDKTTLSRAQTTNHAEDLWAAGEGFEDGTDEETFIDIFTSCSPSQLRQIEKQYEALDQTKFPVDEALDAIEPNEENDQELARMLGEQQFADGKSRLVRAIMSETSFNLQKCLLMLLKDKDEVVVRMLNKAFSGFGTDEELVSYAIGSSSKEHIEAIADLYEDIYGRSLVEVATSELDGLFEGDFQKAVSQYLNRDPLCQPPPAPGSALCDSSQLGRLREEVTEALEYIAMDDAKRIRKACKGFGELFCI